MKDVKDFDDVRWDDGKPTVTDYVWGRDNQTASLIRAYKDEIERLREALKQVGLYAWQGDTFKIMDIVRETIIGKEK